MTTYEDTELVVRALVCAAMENGFSYPDTLILPKRFIATLDDLPALLKNDPTCAPGMLHGMLVREGQHPTVVSHAP